MNRNTEIIYKGDSKAVFNAIRILKRDMNTVFFPTKEQGGTLLLVETKMEEEQFKIEKNTIYAGDELGFVYALLHISEDALKIPPFWFWYDYKAEQRKDAEIKDYTSKPARIRFRGWFLNDEILLSHWSPNCDPMTPWHMAFEALLRCNGNMVIPTTQVSRDHYEVSTPMRCVAPMDVVSETELRSEKISRQKTAPMFVKFLMSYHFRLPNANE